jgi:glucose uptake protein GlcU
MANVISKGYFTSKTVWFNIITGVLAIAGALPALMEQMPFIDAHTVAAVAAACVVVVNVGNLILRKFSKQPVTLRGGEVTQVPHA